MTTRSIDLLALPDVRLSYVGAGQYFCWQWRAFVWLKGLSCDCAANSTVCRRRSFMLGEALRTRPPCGSLCSVPAGPDLRSASSPPLAIPAHQGAAALPSWLHG